MILHYEYAKIPEVAKKPWKPKRKDYASQKTYDKAMKSYRRRNV